MKYELIISMELQSKDMPNTAPQFILVWFGRGCLGSGAVNNHQIPVGGASGEGLLISGRIRIYAFGVERSHTPLGHLSVWAVKIG